MKRQIAILAASLLALGVWGAANVADAARQPARTITLYDQDGFQGYKRTFNGVVWNLDRFNFSNAAHSLKANGYWEVCTAANFRGVCKVVRGDLRDLNQIGMSSRISSVRPINPR
ncbi:MAG: beta/gamma crystallin-related protein [Caulobacteraceae bacterium]